MTPFGVRQFRKLLAGCLLINFLMFLVAMMGNVLAGRFLGEQGLAGVALAAPLVSVANFLFALVGIGLGINYSQRRGRLDRDGAESVFMQGVWASLLFGVALALGAHLLREPYFAFMGAEPETLIHARAYWRWFPLGLLFMFLTNVVTVCCYSDGDTGFATAGVVGQFVVSLAVSCLAFLLPIAGCADASAFSLGSATGYGFSFLLLCGHFLRPGNTFTFAWRFRLADVWAIIRSSSGDALGILSDSFVYIVLGVVMTRSFGGAALVVYPAYVFVSEFNDYANAFSNAMQPIAGVYFGEGNHRSVRVVIKSVFWLLTLMSAAFTLTLLLFPQIVVRTIGIVDPVYVPSAELVVRASALALVPDTILNLMNNYYQTIGRVAVSVAVSVVGCGLLRVVAVLIFPVFGAEGFWYWNAAANAGGVLLFAVFLLWRYGFRRFPWLLDPRREAAIHTFDLHLREMEIATTAEMVAKRMEANGVGHERALKARLLVEETLMVVKERNDGRSVDAEVTLDFDDGVTITLRDDGVIFDLTDADARVNGLRTYLVATMMQHQSEKSNILTTGFNRNVFRL